MDRKHWYDYNRLVMINEWVSYDKRAYLRLYCVAKEKNIDRNKGDNKAIRLPLTVV